MGLVAGFSVRWILPRKVRRAADSARPWYSSSVVWLCLGWFTGWGFGIDLFRAGRSSGGLVGIGPNPAGRPAFALLALYAWQYPRSNRAPCNANANRSKKSPRPGESRKNDRNRAPRPATCLASHQARRSSRLHRQSPPNLVKPKRKRSNHSRPRLVLSSQEEHRCPYCLELIDPDDPRGVVECEICHTLHHADCWAITGACQVPHFTA